MNSFRIKDLTSGQKATRKGILEISYKQNLPHLGSCFSSVDVIDGVYQIKDRDEKFVLSNGHAGIALYAVLEEYGFIKRSDIEKLHIHPDRNPRFGIDVSTGSLGQGLPIALGIAFSDRNKNIYCQISDGECAEGSIWEALSIARENKISNLKIIINANGWCAYDSVDSNYLISKVKGFGYDILEIDGHNLNAITKALKFIKKKEYTIIFAKTTTDQFPFLKGLDAHYHVMNENDYRQALSLLK